MKYDREKAVDYAIKWALDRNPSFYDFSNIGGDCTNFCSQALYNGASVMNNTKTFGWYYYSVNNRSPSWTGVNEFCNFLVNNNGKGPFAEFSTVYDIDKGDFIQLGNGDRFYHTLIVTDIKEGEPIVCSHSIDRLNALLSSYYYERLRFIKILGVNK